MSSSTAVKNFTVQQEENPAAALWLADTAAFEKDSAPAWMKALRATGAAAFLQTGIPTPAQEGWQYTNLRSLAPEKFRYSAESAKIDAGKLPAALLAESYRIVLVNGQYQEKLSILPPGVEIASLAEAQGAEDHLVTVGSLADSPFVALNSAYVRDGFVFKVAPHKDIDKPVEVLFYSTGDGKAFHPRVVYWLGENSGVTVIERFEGTGAYLMNMYEGIALEKASRLKLYRFADESQSAVHVSQTVVRQGKGASFEGFSGAFGGHVTRQEVRLELIDAGISGSISGIYLMKGQQGHDFTVKADHFEPGGTSIQHFKGVIDDQARAVFQGKIQVHRPAQKTDGYQSHHALLLSDRAEANARPELEIYADDVKCSHGATAGMLDQEALFYLQSRGIPANLAKALLIESFLSEGIEKITYEPVRDIYMARVRAWLEARGA